MGAHFPTCTGVHMDPLYPNEPSYLSKALFTASTHIIYTEHKDVLAVIIVSTAKKRREIRNNSRDNVSKNFFTCPSAKSSKMPSRITTSSRNSVATAVHSYLTSKTASANSDSFMTDRVIYPQFQTFNIYSSQSLYNAFQLKYS